MTATPRFFGACAEHAGARHIRSRINGQDRAAFGKITFNGASYRFGLSIDGNGSGRDSEFGAIKARDHLSFEITRMIGDGCPLTEMPQRLFDSLEDELRRILPVWPKKQVVRYILDKLLFTVFGFVQGPDTTVIFYLGDGIVLVNNEEVVGRSGHSEQQGSPDYIAYALFDRIDSRFFENHTDIKAGRGEVYSPPAAFHTLVYDTEDIYNLSVGSDAWLDDTEYDARLLWKIWDGLDPSYPEDLQEKINVWAGIPFRNPKGTIYFQDDVSVACIHRVDMDGEQVAFVPPPHKENTDA